MNTIWLDLLGAEVRFRGRKFTTRTIETGTHNPEKLILMHGIGGHAEAYSRNMQRLGEKYHTIAIDLVWHGLSSKPEFTLDMIRTYARQYLDLLDDLGVEKASIEGESLGGWVALRLALHHPDRVDRIVLNTTAGIRWNADMVKIDEVGGTNLLRERSLAAINDPTLETIRKRLEWLMASPDQVTDELVDLRHTLYLRPDVNAALKNVFANSFLGSHAKDAVAEDELAKITAPTLVLWSEKNPGAGADAGERLAKLIPGASHYLIGDAGHWPQWEKPEEHDRAVLAFMAGQPLRSGSAAVPA
jgi:pimeloyl-ACP methyl ester carboxylesterase